MDYDRAVLEECLRRRFFIVPSFEIYGGVRGLYDMGPPACAIKSNLLAEWRKHFVIHDSMFELDASSLTPDTVFAASGHLERFTDLMVRDDETGDCFRADQLLEEWCEKRCVYTYIHIV
ncbi:glycyl-tRNA synthetase/DNA polymerase subunit gamma-2 [Kipferlia bialata]|uniref:Glycyl-tRNA synthetase/DNA polymerase subunit gamma-2 n=1 Tax=Kipferlia bialata TaxID=797122 RepID=A0A9K3DAZ6_9EUKA|nr:glycyl-tRNA synthetase/DNA polymerase subunit gamma-2 [Kipferlia bialata]|eukprot:g14832.t1